MQPSGIGAAVGLVVPLSLMGFVGLAAAQDRVQRSIAGPVTQEAVTRSLAVVPVLKHYR